MNIYYPETLPVSKYRQTILELLAENQVIIVEGDTGSGKTTQLPKFCLEFLGEKSGIIGCTQPRRIAASTVSARVKEELGSSGNLVGYKIRFHDKTSADTKIKFMTDGVLLAETKTDPELKKYNIIIVDEAHERSLNIDFILGYLKKLQPKRPDLKIIITSATIDTKIFASHFNNAPVVSIEGKTYPVEIRYLPCEESETDQGYLEHCIQSIQDFRKTVPPGDMLVFLPTEKDIRQCCEVLQGAIKDAVILPMFGRLQTGDQKAVFKSYPKPKIVISTNVAETSVTVPGISYVIDTGLARISQYNVRAKTTSLPVTKISQASCDQRKGRCGRIGPGICLRLFSEEDFLNRTKYTLPEIKRANLASVILQMSSLNLGSPLSFPFVEPPLPRAIRDGEQLLTELGAINTKKKLTTSGKFMADLPIDPCISRIILEAQAQGCLTEIQIIASALAIQDPRVRPADKEKEADLAHKEFHHKHSDFLTLLNIWNRLHETFANNFSWSKLKKFCKTHYLSFQRIREWIDLHDQMERILKRRKNITYNTKEASYAQIHLALTAGYLRNIAHKTKDNFYRGPHNLELMIFPGSHLFKNSGQWILAATFLETNRLYALNVATIEPEWLETTGKHLCKTSYTNPRWNKKSGQVIADERVTLFGLPIVPSRQSRYGNDLKHREEARAIFIQSALLHGEIHGNYKFLTHNQQLIERWKSAEDKIRKVNIIVEDIQLIEFYQKRLPYSVYNRKTLNRFLAKSKGNRAKLKMTDEDVLARKPEKSELADYPEEIHLGSIRVKVTYKFSPGAEDDGMTVHIPVSLVHTVKQERFDWLVPGLLPDRLHHMLKGLPKSIRKHLVPLNVTVDRILDNIDFGKGSLYKAVERTIFKFFKISITKKDWQNQLPPHLTPRFIIYEQKDILSAGKDLSQLIEGLDRVPSSSATLSPVNSDLQRISGYKDKVYTTCNFEDLDKPILLYSELNKAEGMLFPTLFQKPEQGGVTVDFVEDRRQAAAQNNYGMVCLYRLQFGKQYKAFKKYCSSALSAPSSAYFFRSYKEKNKLIEDALFFVLSEIFQCKDGSIHSKDQFDKKLETVTKNGFILQCQEHLDSIIHKIKIYLKVTETLTRFRQLSIKTKSLDEKCFQRFEQAATMFLPSDFLHTFTYDQVQSTDKLLQSLNTRIERAYASPLKEEEKAKQYAAYLDNLEKLKNKTDLGEECKTATDHYRQMVYEYHIALFTPEIKTRFKVSAKKLHALWQEIIHDC